MLQPRVSVKDRVKKLNACAEEAEASATWPRSKALGESRIPRSNTVDSPAAGNGQPPASSQVQEPPSSQTTEQARGGHPPKDNTVPQNANTDTTSGPQAQFQRITEGLDETQLQPNQAVSTQVVPTGSEPSENPDRPFVSSNPQNETAKGPVDKAKDTPATFNKEPEVSAPSSSLTTISPIDLADIPISSNGSFGRRQTARIGPPATHGVKLPETSKAPFQVEQVSYERGTHLPHQEHEPDAPIWSDKPCPHHDHSGLQESGASGNATSDDEHALPVTIGSQARSALPATQSSMPETATQGQDNSMPVNIDATDRMPNASRIRVTIVEKASSVDSDEADEHAEDNKDRSANVKTVDMPNRTDANLREPAQDSQQMSVSERISPWVRVNASGERVFMPMTGRRAASRSNYGSETGNASKNVDSSVAIRVKLAEDRQNIQPSAVSKRTETCPKPADNSSEQPSKPPNDVSGNPTAACSLSTSLSPGKLEPEPSQAGDTNDIKQKPEIVISVNPAQAVDSGSGNFLASKLQPNEPHLTQNAGSTSTVSCLEDPPPRAEVPQDESQTLRVTTSVPLRDVLAREAPPAIREKGQSSPSCMKHPVPLLEFGDVSGAPAFGPSGIPESLVAKNAPLALQQAILPDLEKRTSLDVRPALHLPTAQDDTGDITSRAVRHEECGPLKTIREHDVASVVVTAGQASETEIATSPRDKNVLHREGPLISSTQPIKPLANEYHTPATETAGSTINISARTNPPDEVVTMQVRLNDNNTNHGPKDDSTTALCPRNSDQDPAKQLTQAERYVANPTQTVKLSTALDFFLSTSPKTQLPESGLNEACASPVEVQSRSSTPTKLQDDSIRSRDAGHPFIKASQEVQNTADAVVCPKPVVAAVTSSALKSVDTAAGSKVAASQADLDEKPKTILKKVESYNDELLKNASPSRLPGEFLSSGILNFPRATHDERDPGQEDVLEARRRALLDVVRDIQEACKERQAAVEIVFKDLLRGLKDYKEGSDPSTSHIDRLIELVERHAKEDWSVDIDSKLAVLSKAADEDQRARAEFVSPPQPRRPDPLIVSPSSSPTTSRRSSNLVAVDAKPSSRADPATGVRLLRPGTREQWFNDCDVIIRPWAMSRRQLSEDGSSGSETVHEIIKSYAR